MPGLDEKHKWLILPIENHVREFYGKFLLSLVAAEHGWGTVIAYKGYIRYNLPDVKGVVIEINMTDGERIARYEQMGWKACAWDEEGLIYLNGDEYSRRRINTSALLNLESVFLWGENQFKDLISHFPGIENKLVLSGNPRFDLLRPDLRQFYAPMVAEIRNAYGKYILINSNFGTVNHFFGKDYIFNTLKSQGKLSTKELENDQIDREKFEGAIMQAFTNMLPVLGEQFPDYKIIVRPHPSENFETWQTIVKDFPNVFMIHEGDAVPWLLGADVIIHNSCTTGLQGYLLGQPVISYMPVESEKYDKYLPNAVSFRVQDVDELVALVKDIIAPSGPIDLLEYEKRQAAGKYISGLEGPWAADQIMIEVDKLDVNPQKLDIASFTKTEAAPHHSAGNLSAPNKMLAVIRNWKRRIKSRGLKLKGTDWEIYTRQRFPVLSSVDLQGDLQRLQHLTGRFSEVQVMQIGKDVICIYPLK